MPPVVALALLVALAPAPVVGPAAAEARGAASAGVRIDWQGPPECDGAAPLRRRLDALLARASSTSPPIGEVHARVRSSAAALGRYTMELEVRSAAGVWRRTLDGEACPAMIAAAALIAAINLDPLATSAAVELDRSPTAVAIDRDPRATTTTNVVGDASSSRPSSPAAAPGPSPEDEPIAEPRPPADASKTADPRPRRRLAFVARVGAGAVYGPAPRLGALLLAGVGLAIGRRALIEVAAIHRVEDRRAVLGAPEVSVESAMTGARIGACGRLASGSIELPLCAGLDLGALRAEAIGLARSSPSRSLYAALIASARLLWRPAPSIGLGLEVGGGPALTRWAYRIGDLAAPVMTTTPAIGHAGVSFEVRLP